jgi:hypothetical protein
VRSLTAAAVNHPTTLKGGEDEGAGAPHKSKKARWQEEDDDEDGANTAPAPSATATAPVESEAAVVVRCPPMSSARPRHRIFGTCSQLSLPPPPPHHVDYPPQAAIDISKADPSDVRHLLTTLLLDVTGSETREVATQAMATHRSQALSSLVGYGSDDDDDDE